MLAVVAGVLALLCGSGAVVGFVLYDRATAPDRSAPDVVVASFIQAFLDDRNDAKAEEFTCQNGGDLAGLRTFRDDLVAREERFGAKISVSWENIRIQQQGDVAKVQVDLVLSAFVDGVSQSDRQGWDFETRQNDGWRVCTARPA